MDETHLFQADNLQILVMDEVDRLMDMGFKETVD
jgi:ATP-dependent RNA helicase DDX10/DBP4